MKKNRYNKNIILFSLLIMITVMFFVVVFYTLNFTTLFGSGFDQPERRPPPPRPTKTPISEVHKRGGEVLYYGPNEENEIFYDPEIISREEVEKMIEYPETTNPQQ